MDRKVFRQLLKRYLDNSCTEEERRIVDQWYELLDKEQEQLSPAEMAAVEDRLWNKIQSAAFEQQLKPQRTIKMLWWKYAAAVCFIGVTAAGFLWFKKGTSAPDTSMVITKIEQGFSKEINNTDSIKKVQLEDGTLVLLHPGSRLAYPGHFDANKREVYLEGEAFFSVSKNPNRPFYVYNNQIVTQVLGTSFDVRSKNGQVEVAVKTGRVAVYENKEQMKLSEAQQKSNGVIITPNQKVIYYEQERHFVTSIVDRPVPVAKDAIGEIVERNFNYNETPLYKVLEDLENTYELEIVLENDKIKNCLFTGDLTEQNLFNKLEGVCLAFNAGYEVKGTKILLKGGKDCTTN
jgi:transmembrane sensor